MFWLLTVKKFGRVQNRRSFDVPVVCSWIFCFSSFGRSAVCGCAPALLGWLVLVSLGAAVGCSCGCAPGVELFCPDCAALSAIPNNTHPNKNAKNLTASALQSCGIDSLLMPAYRPEMRLCRSFSPTLSIAI